MESLKKKKLFFCPACSVTYTREDIVYIYDPHVGMDVCIHCYRRQQKALKKEGLGGV